MRSRGRSREALAALAVALVFGIPIVRLTGVRGRHRDARDPRGDERLHPADELDHARHEHDDRSPADNDDAHDDDLGDRGDRGGLPLQAVAQRPAPARIARERPRLALGRRQRRARALLRVRPLRLRVRRRGRAVRPLLHHLQLPRLLLRPHVPDDRDARRGRPGQRLGRRRRHQLPDRHLRVLPALRGQRHQRRDRALGHRRRGDGARAAGRADPAAEGPDRGREIPWPGDWRWLQRRRQRARGRSQPAAPSSGGPQRSQITRLPKSSTSSVCRGGRASSSSAPRPRAGPRP